MRVIGSIEGLGFSILRITEMQNTEKSNEVTSKQRRKHYGKSIQIIVTSK